MEPLYKRYEDQKPVGVWASGYCGYLFFEPIDDDKYTCDYVVCFENPYSKSPNGYARSNYRRHNITYTNSYDNPRALIWRDHMRVYLDDVLRTDLF